MLCNDLILCYQDLWQIGMYRVSGKWILKDVTSNILTFTTEEAIQYVKDNSNN